MLKHAIDSPPREPTITVRPAHEELSFASGGRSASSEIVEISRWVAEVLNHRFIVDDPKRVLTNEELPLLIEPLTTRLRSGVLPQTESDLLTLACGVTNGGLPLEVFIKNPCIDLSMDGRTDFSGSRWLPPHLSERAVTLPAREGESAEFNHQNYRVISAIQKGLSEVNPNIPVFFLGSSASLALKHVNDIDVGTSSELRRHFNSSDETYRYDFDRLADVVCKNLREGKPVLGWRSHVGASWEYMPLAIGISVARHGRAFRVTPSEVFIIESEDRCVSVRSRSGAEG